jgi:DNA-binding response OmpR family regulator
MRVLLVEDEDRLAENVASALREGPGYAVDIAQDGEVAVYLARGLCYDLVVLDLMLPKIDGAGVLHNIRAAGDTTPVLILTAQGETQSIIRLLNEGADDYLSKPFDLGELIARAKALIRRGASHHQGVGHRDQYAGTARETGRKVDRSFAHGISHPGISGPPPACGGIEA